MNTDLENALRSIEVARTKLQLLSSGSLGNENLSKLGALLDQAHAILSEAPDTPTQVAPPVEITQILADNQSSDFTLIKKIDPAMASSLAAAGINSFDEIANLRADDVKNLAATLSLGTRINHENWIEEAAILAKGDETAYVRSLPPVRPTQEIPQDADLSEPTAPEPLAPEPIAPEPIAVAGITPAPLVPEQIPTEPEAPASIAPELAVATPAAATSYDASIEDTPPESAAPAEPTEFVEPATIAEPKAADIELAEADVAPPNDRREASIEIKPRTDSQLAYPNSDEDPDKVVKRFMRALTGDSEKDQ